MKLTLAMPLGMGPQARAAAIRAAATRRRYRACACRPRSRDGTRFHSGTIAHAGNLCNLARLRLGQSLASGRDRKAEAWDFSAFGKLTPKLVRFVHARCQINPLRRSSATVEFVHASSVSRRLFRCQFTKCTKLLAWLRQLPWFTKRRQIITLQKCPGCLASSSRVW